MYIVIIYGNYLLEKSIREYLMRLCDKQEEEKSWKQIVNDIPQGILIFDGNEDIQFVNSYFKQLVIRKPKETLHTCSYRAEEITNESIKQITMKMVSLKIAESRHSLEAS